MKKHDLGPLRAGYSSLHVEFKVDFSLNEHMFGDLVAAPLCLMSHDLPCPRNYLAAPCPMHTNTLNATLGNYANRISS